ncbi:MAG TPA: (2Fe-2S)-binding protein [Candidatus Thermoplasmatota archaeon]|nr:(2Fe-2S)-binding protein [Candidatus Thermoplasmatota archaeon]
MKRSIVCRCEDISEEDVIHAIEEGYTDIEELRKKLRIGMGPCQGRVCIQLVARILEKKTGKKVACIPLPTVRPPLVPVSLGTLASEKDEK